MQTAEIIQSIRELQRLFNDQIATNLTAIQQEHSLAAYLGLALIGFIYGALHAIGPGHGKVVVAGYMLANQNSLKRGLMVVGLSSLMQAVTAIVIIVGFHVVLQVTRAEAENIARLLEMAGMAVIGALGFMLVVQGVMALKKLLLPQKIVHHHHGHHHHDGCGCGHAHAPSAAELDAKPGALSMAAMVVSIGLRPCTGALLLLFFACGVGLVEAGIFATFAMAAGTALTTGLLAYITVKSKDLALKLVKQSNDQWVTCAHALLRVLGGVLILLLAGLFMLAAVDKGESSTVAPTQHPLFRAR